MTCLKCKRIAPQKCAEHAPCEPCTAIDQGRSAFCRTHGRVMIAPKDSGTPMGRVIEALAASITGEKRREEDPTIFYLCSGCGSAYGYLKSEITAWRAFDPPGWGGIQISYWPAGSEGLGSLRVRFCERCSPLIASELVKVRR